MIVILLVIGSYALSQTTDGSKADGSKAEDSKAGDSITENTITAEQFGLEHLTDYLGLKPDDISFRADYSDPDSVRLKLIADLMTSPLGMIGYADGLALAHSKTQPEILARIIAGDLAWEIPPDIVATPRTSLPGTYNLYYTDPMLNGLLSRAAEYVDHILPDASRQMLAALTAQQKQGLKDRFRELIESSVEEEFWSVEKLDSLEKVEEAYATELAGFAAKINPQPLVNAGVDFLTRLMPELKALRRALASGAVNASQIMTGTGAMPSGIDMSSYLGRQPGWKVGGPGNDYYSGDYKVIIDLGGDDVYDLTYDLDNPHAVIIIDLFGNDRYRGETDFTLGSGAFSAGILLDFEGNDQYVGQSFSVGSGFFGFGLLYDAAGDDFYSGDTHVEGAGSFGVGLLIDEGGRDIYNGALHAQGFGFVSGYGMIFEVEGSDTYYAGGKYKDYGRYEDHYLSLSQGFGFGLRPWLSGGVGAIVDLKGNDTFNSDIFAQGTGYWWGLGILFNGEGRDNYQSFQYAQGSATHMALGILVDNSGSDVYQGKGLMQGVGHDYACGIILDRGGDDNYFSYDLSQGAGSANGAGLLIDTEGDDRYFVKNQANTQGYGNPRRNFGSIGLFIDLGGTDQYWGNGRDNFYWKTASKWGGGMDIELHPSDTTETGGDQ